MAVALERTKMFVSVFSEEFLRTAKSFWELERSGASQTRGHTVAGMIRDAEATAIKEDIVDATVSLKRCSIPDTMPVRVLWIPPAIKQHPNTKRIFDRMLPSMLDCTILISPFFNATILTFKSKLVRQLVVFMLQVLTISSTAFPKVAFSSPPKVWPSFADISSVANERTAASGTIAKKLRTNTVVGFQPATPAIMPRGTKTRRTLT
jgi:hypothetical protein